jgi:hypothetical protein
LWERVWMFGERTRRVIDLLIGCFSVWLTLGVFCWSSENREITHMVWSGRVGLVWSGLGMWLLVWMARVGSGG